MPASPLRLSAAVLVLSMAGVAHAAQVERVDIRGLDDTMKLNVEVSLSLVDAIGKDLSGRRLAYLLREAEHETREALEPFGYYSPTITIERTRDGVTTVVDTAPGATSAPAPGTPATPVAPPATTTGDAPATPAAEASAPTPTDPPPASAPADDPA